MPRCDSPAYQFSGHRQRIPVGAVWAALLAGVVGCGAGEYQKRLEARVADLATASEFAGLYGAQALGNKPVSVRVPQSFTRPPLVAGVEIAEEGAAPDEGRVQPGVIDLPGLTYTYEEFVADADGGRIPYYLYVSAEDTTRPGFRDPTARWLNLTRDRFDAQDVAWENVECHTPEGRSVIWRRLRVEGEQAFYYVGQGGQGRMARLPGILEIYHRVDGDWAVTLVWRVPTGIVAHVELTKWAPMVAGAVEFQGQAGASGVH